MEKRYHKVSYKSCLSKSMLKLYFETLVLALHCYCGDNVKYGLLSKHLLQRKLQYGGWKNLKVTTKFYKKQWLPVIKWNKKYSSK